VLDRDGNTCQPRYTGCTVTATEVDHIRNAGRPSRDRWQPDDINNLQAVCRHCHSIKTRREAATARSSWKRPAEKHPGII